MAILRKQVRPDRFAQPAPPIKYLTENGFSIVRLSDLDSSLIDTPAQCRFVVQHEDATERDVTISFDQDLIERLRIRRRISLAETSTFWVVCAESYLATYLWEKNEYPPDGRLMVNELSPDESMLALHWRDRE